MIDSQVCVCVCVCECVCVCVSVFVRGVLPCVFFFRLLGNCRDEIAHAVAVAVAGADWQ